MALYDNGSDIVMPVTPMNGNNGSIGWGGDGSFWIIILFLFAMFNGGWGGFGGFGGNNGMFPYMMNNTTNSDMQRSFDQQAVMGGINGITSALNSGFGNIQTSLCNGFAGVNAGVANGFAQAEIANNSRQMANMNQIFGLQTGISNQINNLAMGQQVNACENRAAVADLKYTVATEACSDRNTVNNALRDVTAQGVANTTALMNTINGGIQSIKDQLCQDKIDAKNDTINQLRSELMYARGQASQDVQTAAIQSGQRMLANEIEQYVAPKAVPAYIVQNPNCCSPYTGCGCGTM